MERLSLLDLPPHPSGGRLRSASFQSVGESDWRSNIFDEMLDGLPDGDLLPSQEPTGPDGSDA